MTDVICDLLTRSKPIFVFFLSIELYNGMFFTQSARVAHNFQSNAKSRFALWFACCSLISPLNFMRCFLFLIFTLGFSSFVCFSFIFNVQLDQVEILFGRLVVWLTRFQTPKYLTKLSAHFSGAQCHVLRV